MKLAKACREEAAKLEEGGLPSLTEDERRRLGAKYRRVYSDVNVQHCVMVFVPSDALTKLATEGRANTDQYRDQYRKEEKDVGNLPSNHSMECKYNHIMCLSTVCVALCWVFIALILANCFAIRVGPT
eukprot:1996872-Amphidinium_carterae.1